MHGLFQIGDLVWQLRRDILLLTRIFMDMQRAAERWYEPADFVTELLPETSAESRDALAGELAVLLAFDSLVADDPKTLEVCDRWDTLCTELFHAYQDEAVAEVESAESTESS